MNSNVFVLCFCQEHSVLLNHSVMKIADFLPAGVRFIQISFSVDFDLVRNTPLVFACEMGIGNCFKISVLVLLISMVSGFSLLSL